MNKYYRYELLQKYVDGVATEEYKIDLNSEISGEWYDNAECASGREERGIITVKTSSELSDEGKIYQGAVEVTFPKYVEWEFNPEPNKTIRFENDFDLIMVNKPYKLTTCNSMFASTGIGGVFNIELLDTSDVTDMTQMFHQFRLTDKQQNFTKNLNTAKVTDMTDMFSLCDAITSLDLSNFDTSNVTLMSSMFRGCNYLTDVNLSSFNTLNVTSMQRMFEDCVNLESIDVSSFDVSNVTSMRGMFARCEKLTSLDLSLFNPTKLRDCTSMFNGCSSLETLDVSNFDAFSITGINYMFQYCSSLNTIRCNKGFQDLCKEYKYEMKLNNYNSINWEIV